MESRPKVKLHLTTSDKLFEAMGWIALVTLWVYTLTHYAKLPEIIPTHYNGAGEVDGHGGKGNILALPIVATVLFVALTILNQFPYAFNYPTNITPENFLKQYTSATRFIRYMKFVVVVIFGAIAIETIQNTLTSSEGLGVWFLPITLGVIFIPLVFFIITSFKSK